MSTVRKAAGGRGVISWGVSAVVHVLVLLLLAAIVLTAVREQMSEVVVQLEPVGRPNDASSESSGGSAPHVEKTSSTTPSRMLAPLPAPALESAEGRTPSPSDADMASESEQTDPALALLSELTQEAEAAHTGRGDNPLVDGTSEGFQQMLGGIRGRGLNVVFVIDATESMKGIMEQAKERMRDVIGVITGVLNQDGRPPRNIEFGIVAFKDYGDDYGVDTVRVLQLTNDFDKVREFIDGIQTSGGGDEPEPIHEALARAINSQMGWSTRAKKLIVLISDAPVHPTGRSDAIEAARRFATRSKGTVSVIDVGTGRAAVLGDFAAIAKAGNGTATLLGSEDAFWEDLVVTVFGKRFERDVRMIVERYAKSNR